MKFPTCLRLLAVTLFFYVSAANSGEQTCDCTTFPFKPDPPCVDTCVPKHLAVASEGELENVFGLPSAAAEKVAAIPPNKRPRSIEGYEPIINEAAYQKMLQKISVLKASDYEQIRGSAKLRGLSLNGLEW
jgi:hypothetical protein